MNGWARAGFWLVMLLVLALLVDLLRSILLPFVLGATLAFMLDPLVDRLTRSRVPRTLAALLVLTGSLLVLGLLAVVLLPLLERQLSQFFSNLPGYVAEARNQMDRLIRFAQASLPPDQLKELRDAAGAEVSEVVGRIGELLGSVLTGGLAIANLLSLVIITPIVTFFLLRDWPGIVRSLDDAIPRAHLATVREQARLIEETLSGFVRGQATVCLLMGIYYAIGLSLIGVDSALVIGAVCGLLIFIPYLGGLTGTVISVLVALAQFGSWRAALVVAILFVVGQMAEGNVITPKLVGDRVHLHPVWMIFSLLAFGVLLGFVGILIAVPVAAVLGVLIRFALARYRESSIYDPARASVEPTEV